MCESTTIKVGLSCLVDGKVGVEPRSQGRKIPGKNEGFLVQKKTLMNRSPGTKNETKNNVDLGNNPT